MAEDKKEKNQDAVIQNLKDAGCESETIENFMDYEKEGEVTKELELLSCHRKCLLENLHICQKQIDCLDYLIYQMKKKGKNKKDE